MNAYLRNVISEYLKQTNQNLSMEKIKVVKNKVNIDLSDIGTSTDGIKYHKSELTKYFLDNKIPTDQYHIDMYAKGFRINIDDNDEVTVSHSERFQIEELDNLSDSDFNNYISFLLLKNIAELNDLLSEKRQDGFTPNNKQYAVECVYDNFRGGLNINKFVSVLNMYAENGWTLKFIFTNELGKNAVSLSGFGTNSTQDQIILIFEK